MSSLGLSTGQYTALVVTERVNSCVSIAGIFFVVLTYLFAPGFNKPINRLIFFASFGNLGSNIAALISEKGPTAGALSPLCQFQAFLVQMFLGVDCYWACCMALNVYLVFFRGYTVEQLRLLDVVYLLVCYGLSFIPALVFIFLSTKARGPIYGPAIIWCWITTEWDFMRIVFLYGIVWIAIVVAFTVYGKAAKVIWDKRQHLDGFWNPLNENPFVNTITTEIEITHEERPIVKDSATQAVSDPLADVDYSVEVRVETQRQRPLPAALRMRSITRNVAERATNAEAWLYARVAFLFFVALLITWIPSSVNRVYALIYPNVLNFPLNYLASFVFPLQAFWNAIVYIITSQSACRHLWKSLFARSSRKTSLPSTLTGRNLEDAYLSRGKQRLRSFSGSGEQVATDSRSQELHDLSKNRSGS
ncbi:hypothetical protein VTN77DRAFT_4657 [Rasamsonia byssochlamydoides]|uniref:uncharacterized protein n=1 Tax=Rasamsonia byssochlamydoides TaxID=89139 RepID=UPI003743DD7A